MFKKITKLTPGTRHKISLRKSTLCRYNNLIKNLKVPYLSKAGRNSTGRITVRHKGSGCKKSLHVLDHNSNYTAVVITTFYDSRRNAYISLLFNFETESFLKTIAIDHVGPGSIIRSAKKLPELKVGYRGSLAQMPLGTILNSISTNNKISFCRSAGSFCQVIEVTPKHLQLRLPSGKIIYASLNQFGTVGIVSNVDYKNTRIGKAGVNRLKGIRPSVRGIAMNPVDHPHGGKSNKGMIPVTPWGIPTKGKPTVKKKNYHL